MIGPGAAGADELMGRVMRPRGRFVLAAVVAGLVGALPGTGQATSSTGEATPGLGEGTPGLGRATPDPDQVTPGLGEAALGSSPRAATDRPNIVVIMVDDMSSEIADYMDGVQDLRAGAVSFSNYFVSNSLCCPSRATYLTGKYPHNSEVEGNYWPQGGFAQFYKHDEDASLAPLLSAAGYRTGLIGKYLNQYDPAGDTDGVKPPDYPAAYVPPGWNEWFSTGWGYQQFDYQAVDSVDGVTQVVDYTGGKEENYFTDVMSKRAGEFIDRAVTGADHAPFFLSLTPFAVHSARPKEDPQQPDAPHFPPAPRDRADSPNRPVEWFAPEFADGDCGVDVTAPQSGGGCDDVAFPDSTWGSFNLPVTDPAKHMPTEPLTGAQLDSMEADHLERVQSAQAVDDLLTSVRADLQAAGVADDTYIVFTSDNGFHLGEHALTQGKGTAYDHDVRVPLIVYPPGGTLPRTEPLLAQNTDLLPTLLDIAGAAVPPDVDGASLLGLVDPTAAGAPAPWRRAVYVEYRGFQDRPEERGRVSALLDPDAADVDHVPPYHALRAASYLYVDYSTLDAAAPKRGKAEYFDLRVDPYELHNIYATLSHRKRAALNDATVTYSTCAGSACWQAGLDAPPS